MAPVPIPSRTPAEVQCWGHRGASAHLPENTLASFQAAIVEGADAIESDVHATKDAVVLMFHDPSLDRTTDGRGMIRNQNWFGQIEHVRTKKKPIQPIPTFEQLVALIMKPENRHVSLNIDCKVQNDPETLFPLMAKTISAYPDFETELSPRIILGLWHPLFLPSALTHLPTLRRFHIGLSVALARHYFWDAVDGFSMAFPLMIGTDGQAFLEECRANGKEITVWTVNDEEEMKVAVSWGVKAVLTDCVAKFVQLKKELIKDPTKVELAPLAKLLFPWSSWRYYYPAHLVLNRWQHDMLQTHCYSPGPLALPDLTTVTPPAAKV